jgi:hypothetical protein
VPPLLVVPPELAALVEAPPLPPALKPPEEVTAPPWLPPEPAGAPELPKLQPRSEVSAKIPTKIWKENVFMAK